MKEQVRNTNHPWLVGVVVALIVCVYFVLLGTSEHPEPGANLVYDVKVYEELDRIPTNYEEMPAVALSVDNARAMAVHGDRLFIAGKDVVAVLGPDQKETGRYAVQGTPNCLSIAPDGAIVLGMTDHVEILTKDGAPQASWEKIGGQAFISSVAADEDSVFVGDAGNRRVLHYDWQGKVQARIGEKDTARDIPGIEAPSPYLDLAVNPDGDLWVVNPGKLGMERYRDTGEIVTSWYRPSLELDGFSGCCNPTQIAFTPQGELITCEKGLVRIKRYDVTSGEFGELIAGSQLFPREQSVRDIAVDQSGRILVLDPRENSVRIFVAKGTGDGRTAKQT